MGKIEIPNNQLVEIRWLAALFLEVINTAEGCISKLRKGFIEPIDTEDIRIRIKGMQIQILQIDKFADEALENQADNTNPNQPIQ